MRRPMLVLILIAGITPQAQAWKSKAYKFGIKLNSSAHESQTLRAIELLQASNAQNTKEWAAFQQALVDASGSLIGDSNAHGNIIFMGEREDPDGKSLLDQNGNLIIKETAIAYNGGPFYRYWIRALEAHNQVSGDVGMDVRRFIAVSGRKTYDTYRYFGYLAHLVEDQCVPAHACNVRHGPWDGVEWWHWQSITLGGGGVADPLPIAQLGPYLAQAGGWDNHFEFSNFWFKERQIGSDRGVSKKANITLFNEVQNFLTSVVQDTQNWWTPGLANQFLINHFFDDFLIGGHVLGEEDLQAIWKAEDMKNQPGFTPSDANVGYGWIAFTRPLRNLAIPVDGSQPSVNFYEVRPQFKPGPASHQGSIWVGNDYRRLGNTLEQTQGAYGQLNQNSSPWLPNPNYKGEAFDGRWGSYGGAWGIPGRVSVEGHQALSNYVADALGIGQGRITPGDLYTLHTDTPYDPAHPYTWRDNVGGIDLDWTGYNDERTFATIGVNESLQDIGFNQINKAAVWTAVLLENLSRALPPRIVDLKMTNRMSGTPYLPDLALLMRTTAVQGIGVSGAWIDLKIGTNRMDDYNVEFYAVPQKWFINQGDGIGRWQRRITLKQGQSLWPSDITVNVTDYGLGQDGNPTNAVTDPFGVFSRGYDYAYDRMPVIPLKIITGGWAVSQVKLGSAGIGPLVVTDEPVSIPSAEVALNPLFVAAAAETMETDPYAFSQTFTWTGEVGTPKGMFSDAMPDGAGTAADYLKDPKAKVKTLRDGDYFLLAVVYRKFWRDAFARNQFKILYPDKQLLEKGAWFSSAWSPGFLKACQGATSPPANTPMIPDELIPFHFDSTAPNLLAQ